jgi:hypothetical protein
MREREKWEYRGLRNTEGSLLWNKCTITVLCVTQSDTTKGFSLSFRFVNNFGTNGWTNCLNTVPMKIFGSSCTDTVFRKIKNSNVSSVNMQLNFFTEIGLLLCYESVIGSKLFQKVTVGSPVFYRFSLSVVTHHLQTMPSMLSTSKHWSTYFTTFAVHKCISFSLW